MKRNTIILAVVAALLAVGCNREEMPELTPTGTVRNVSYVACGEDGHETVTDDARWNTLMNKLFYAVGGVGNQS